MKFHKLTYSEKQSKFSSSHRLRRIKHHQKYWLMGLIYPQYFVVRSIVFEVIRTISSLFIFFFHGKKLSVKKGPKCKTNVLVRAKNCRLCCLLFAYFCFVSFAYAVFLCAQNFFVKRKQT